jgi:hypothetical protein
MKFLQSFNDNEKSALLKTIGVLLFVVGILAPCIIFASPLPAFVVLAFVVLFCIIFSILFCAIYYLIKAMGDPL